MIGPYIIIAADPPLTLLSIGGAAPGLCYAAITGVGAVHQPADGSEAGNVSIDLDNADGFISELLSVPPLGAPSTLYGPDATEWFRGTLASITLADTASLTLES